MLFAVSYFTSCKIFAVCYFSVVFRGGRANTMDDITKQFVKVQVK